MPFIVEVAVVDMCHSISKYVSAYLYGWSCDKGWEM